MFRPLFCQRLLTHRPTSIPIIADALCDQLATACGNSKQIAVYVPNIIPGSPLPTSLLGPLMTPIPKARETEATTPPKASLLQKLWAVVRLLQYVPWYWSIRGAVMLPRCEAFLKAVRKEGFAKVGAAG